MVMAGPLFDCVDAAGQAQPRGRSLLTPQGRLPATTSPPSWRASRT
jgi:hypothetical protein